jgi:hypothetical protein
MFNASIDWFGLFTNWLQLYVKISVEAASANEDREYAWRLKQRENSLVYAAKIY